MLDNAPPPLLLALEIVAVAVNDPVPPLAVNAGEVAAPLASVVADACAPPPANVALAADIVPQVL